MISLILEWLQRKSPGKRWNPAEGIMAAREKCSAVQRTHSIRAREKRPLARATRGCSALYYIGIPRDCT